MLQKNIIFFHCAVDQKRLKTLILNYSKISLKSLVLNFFVPWHSGISSKFLRHNLHIFKKFFEKFYSTPEDLRWQTIVPQHTGWATPSYILWFIPVLEFQNFKFWINNLKKILEQILYKYNNKFSKIYIKEKKFYIRKIISNTLQLHQVSTQ